MVLGQLALFGERQQRPAPAFARFNRKAALALREAGEDEILKQAVGFDAGLVFKVGLRIARPGLAGRRDELVQGNGLDHVRAFG